MNTTNNKELIKKGTKNLALWTSAWLTMLLIVTIGPDVLWDNDLITSDLLAFVVITLLPSNSNKEIMLSFVFVIVEALWLLIKI